MDERPGAAVVQCQRAEQQHTAVMEQVRPDEPMGGRVVQLEHAHVVRRRGSAARRSRARSVVRVDTFSSCVGTRERAMSSRRCRRMDERRRRRSGGTRRASSGGVID